jgi:hypothetical protein
MRCSSDSVRPPSLSSSKYSNTPRSVIWAGRSRGMLGRRRTLKSEGTSGLLILPSPFLSRSRSSWENGGCATGWNESCENPNALT